MKSIYNPADDSYFFQNFLKKYLSTESRKNRNFTFLDMGTGSGILAKTALKFLPPKNITALDINEEAINSLKKEKFNKVKSNLFKSIKEKFDVIVFNAPYLPMDKREPIDSQLATTGGKKGDEISMRFLKQAKNHLKENGKIFLLISSLTPMKRINKFNPKIVAKKKIFMEEIRILEFKN